MIQSLRVLMLLRHEYRRHLEYTLSGIRARSRFASLTALFVRIETCRNLAAAAMSDRRQRA